MYAPKYIFHTKHYKIYSIFDMAVQIDAANIFSLAHPTPIDIPVNVFLLLGGSRKILIDTGGGSNFGPSTKSSLPSGLKTLGLRPSDITDIYLTHIHNDHTGGLVQGHQRVFEQAAIHVHQNELDFWLNDENLTQAKAGVLSASENSFLNAREALTLYLNRHQIRPFTASSTFPPGWRLTEMFGHTPGHSLFTISGGARPLTFCADMVHSAELQFQTPTLFDGFDIDRQKGLSQRLTFYEQASKQRCYLAGAHLPYPGIGILKKLDKHYNWLPLKQSPY